MRRTGRVECTGPVLQKVKARGKVVNLLRQKGLSPGPEGRDDTIRLRPTGAPGESESLVKAGFSNQQ